MRLRLKEPMDGSSLIFCGIEFQIVGAANLKALRPTALAVMRLRLSWGFSLRFVRGRERGDAKQILFSRASGMCLLFQGHSPGGATVVRVTVLVGYCQFSVITQVSCFVTRSW